ncbi:lysophospholipid acyltransferase family protein [Phenylobacterium montanum]|uniref:Lysophospholipid acyltransferase family protein n=1 Tax=Phenylobacterium montanum TaxID=2823693 RepID=A0A975ITY1_9CAUL|nr:lysophospholipid acyltransferase family protein [Caulobacter sp. S6]QUD87195.1 lysophospholipid acyltransferase family protein [Caulobacter sp. S6]
MSSFVRHPLVQSAISWILTGYVNFALETTRWRFEDRAGVDSMVASDQGAIGAFWHGRITMAVVCRRVLKHKPRRVIISASRDGELTARTVERLGFPSIRGSAAKKGKDADKGGAAAFRQALRFMRDGGLIAITPDGPRGPNQVMPEGTVIMAQAAKVPVVLFGLAATPAIQFKSWDKARVPVPFGRGCVVFDGPLYAPAATDEATREATRADWQARLIAAQNKAEAILAGSQV